MPDWLYTTLGWTLAATATALLLWALFGDRAKGRKRCPKCWYNLAGQVSAKPEPPWTCPECGQSIPDLRAASHTRRRRGLALIAILVLLAAYPVGVTSRIIRAGWIGLVPTPALIWIVAEYEPPEHFDQTKRAMTPPTPWAAELSQRAVRGELWSVELTYMLDRLRLLKTPGCWPRGVPVTIISGKPSWLQTQPPLKVTSTLPNQTPHWDDRVIPWTISDVPESAQSLDFQVTLGSWSGDIRRPFRWVDRVDDAITPVISADLDQQVKASLSFWVMDDANSATATNTYIRAELHRDRAGLPSDLAIGLRVELVHDDTVAMTWPSALRDSPYGPPVNWMRFNRPIPGWDSADPASLARWRVRVIGDGAVALQDLDRDKYWSGQFEFPLANVWNVRRTKP